jgi:molybdopterin-dependent oxidoreductase alpha subunit
MAIGGGFKAVRSVLYYAAQIGPFKLWQTLRSKNACKACAFGTGGQKGGWHNELGRGLEVCNKNIQAHTSDIRPAVPAQVFFTRSIAELAQLSAKQREDLGRLTLPLYKRAGDRHYSPLSYEAALQILVERFQRTDPARSFFYASGRSSNEAAFLLQLLARLWGTNTINNCSYYCHQASGVGLGATLGTGTATVTYEDLHQADCIFVWGANPASNHPRFVKLLLQARRRGAQVIVVNPAKEAGLVRFASPSDWRSMLRGGEPVASLYLQPHLGGDMALMAGMAKALLETGQCDTAFIAAATEGFAAYAEQVAGLSWEQISRESGLEEAQIRQAAAAYAKAERAVFCWSMGLTHHQQGVASIESLVALCLLRGQIGRPGAGLLPLRGHSNIQGTGSMGFTPQLKQAVAQALEARLGERLPQTPGLDTMACMQQAHAGQMDMAVCLGGNLLASNPDTAFATAALDRVAFKCFINPTLNLSHVAGVSGDVLILPGRARDEEQQGTTQESMFNFVRLSSGGINRFPQLRSEVAMIVDLGAAVIDPARLDFSLFHSHARIRQWIAESVPGYSALSQLDEGGAEFTVGQRILHRPEFHTPSGKAQFVFHPLPVYAPGYRLTSVRSEGQFNSIVYHENDAYREQTERWVVMMHPSDMAQEGLKQDSLVDISTATGTMARLKVKAFAIRPGNLMVYYPEANVLIPTATDPRSKTPSFKSVVVTLTPSNPAASSH